MTKEEIIARKNALRATGHNVPVDESWGPNLERLWQSVAPGRYMTSNIEQKESDTNHASWYNPLTWAGGIAKGLTRDMARQQFLDKHPIIRNWYMDDERYGNGKGLSSGAETLGKTAIAAAGVQRAVRKQRMLYVAGKFVAKKTRDLARGGHKEALENVADGVETASALYGLGAGGLKAVGKVFNYANKMRKAYDADVIYVYCRFNVVSVDQVVQRIL